MILNFRLKQFVNNEYFCFDYQLSKIETEELINEVGKDFFGISVSNDSDFIRLELDVLFQDKEMIYKIITLISDMFPHYLKSLKNKPKNKRKKKENLIKTFVEETSGIAVDYKNTILLELDKFFMLYYIIIAKRDTSNINRDITNKLHKIGLNTINFVPFVGKLELTDSQLKYIKRKAIKVDELKEEEQNLFILSSNSFNVQKMTENNPPYYIYLYRKSTFSVKNCTQQYYCISVTSTLEQKGFNLLVDFSEEQENIKLSEIFARCKLFNDLCNSIKILSYKEIFGILTNVYNTSILLDNSKISTIKYVLNNIENKQREFWKFISVYLENINYLPQKCKEYCPYSSSCVHAKTMQTTVHIKKNTIERIDKNEKYVTVEESRKELGKVILSAYNSLENDTTDLELIIAQTRVRENRENN